MPCTLSSACSGTCSSLGQAPFNDIDGGEGRDSVQLAGALADSAEMVALVGEMSTSFETV